ncbi:MAG: family 78 glycoside hydrolase catalytic domain, partial [Clostridiales bacterium]|nr:family 78 glycoside hydrolase catalytic domain [Clostridiales bacterium]
MKITRVKVNGIQNPLGFSYDDIQVSWNVVDAAGQELKRFAVELADDPGFANIIARNAGIHQTASVALNAELKPRTQYFARVQVTDDTDQTGTAITSFETGKSGEEWTGKWIGTAEEDEFHPVFEKSFTSSEVAKARLYICGLGLYEAFINGERIGEEFMTPYLNDYDTALQIQTFDVTNQISEGNTIQVFLGNGWYKGIYGEANGLSYGTRFALIAELVLDLKDGSQSVIGTDETWTYKGSDVEDDGIYSGEILNRLLWKGKENPEKSAKLLEKSPGSLVDRRSMPVKVKELLNVKELIKTPAGETVLDMGQNFAGYLQINSTQPEGARIHLEFGEILQNSNFYNDNYRTAKGGFTYVSN